MWSATNGLTIVGSCVSTCTAVALSLTGDSNTYGVTCSYKQFGNMLPSSGDDIGNIKISTNPPKQQFFIKNQMKNKFLSFLR